MSNNKSDNASKERLLAPYGKNVVGYRSRVEFSKPYFKNANVLDIGFVDHDVSDARRKNNFIHDELRSIAKRTVGLDCDCEQVALLQKEGYLAECGDVENTNLTKQLTEKYGSFDVVFAGELIEHLLNIRSFFQTASNVLSPHGKLIITTPNSAGFSHSVGVFKRGTLGGTNPTHTLWFDPLTLLEGAHATGFRLVNFSWYYDEQYLAVNKSLLSHLYYGVYRTLLYFRPYFSDGFIAVLEKQD